MVDSRSDVGDKSFRIKQDDKFFNWLLSRESSLGKNSSSRVLYTGANCAVPFTWESQPGTPKHAFSETGLPPLTPPPSFGYSKLNNKNNKKPLRKHSRASLLHLLLRRLVNKKFMISFSSSSSSSSSFSSPRSAPVTPASPTRHDVKHRRSSSAFDSVLDGEEYVIKSHGSTLCFGIGSRTM